MRTFVVSVTGALASRMAALRPSARRGGHHAPREEDAPGPPAPSLLAHLPGDAVLLVNGDGIVTASGGDASVLLADADKLVGQPLLDLIHEADHDEARRLDLLPTALPATPSPGSGPGALAATPSPNGAGEPPSVTTALDTGPGLRANLASGDGDVRLQARLRGADGTWRWFELVRRDLRTDPTVGQLVVTAHDIDDTVLTARRAAENERALLDLLDVSGSAVFRFGADGTVDYANARWLEITGVPAEELKGTGWRRLVHPEDRERLLRRRPTGTEEEPEEAEFRIVRPDGTVQWVVGRSTAVRDETGAVAGRVGTITDISGHVAARRDSQRLADIFEATHDLVGMVDRTGRVLYLNAAARAFTGIPARRPVDGLNLLDHVPPEVAARLTTEVVADLERDGMWSGELAATRHDGTTVPVLAQLLRHTDETGAVEFFSGIMHDISNRKRYESQLAHQATHDPLTGLPNRSLLLEQLARDLERARRHGTRVAVLFLDLDHFKVVNDSLGHEAGDQVLVALAARLRRAVRPGDTVARFGGDEFVVLCADLMHHPDAVAVAERMRSIVSDPLPVGESEIFVGVSAGIALSDGDADARSLVRDADAAMYRAKERGRSRWEIFDHAMRAHAVYRLDTENSLRRAEERGELQVRYQPIVSLGSGSVVGVEALLRWEHPERGLLPPGDFIPVAEETGLIVPMGAWVLERACQQVARWQAQLPDVAPLRISVNLSGRQLGQPTLVADVRSILDHANLSPDQLELEITESVLMDDVERSSETLRALKSLGVKLVVDDFGTGYSSFSYLQRFPVDVLKVDRSFVDGLGTSPNDSAIVTAIVTLAHTLGLQTVAEGVETPEQLAELRRLGCDLAQGYLMARPGTADDISALLAGPRARW